ncbi:Tubulin-tyrosine ligase/Tubulin polyglutamylase [Carpediemonas membranifera]|uniref:Tubulin--tyrosine ligase-like protein 5 n=1 Tax=Carpediemonas membranifera TaxID=201153 RepID=A0A8J6E040_9EUKA|nr:Tubulin-tyrosine ligase/Tubulin polyglutamylase [Carpediemonas membranifera]|eukprot:KAG9394524.1 Tubulin-tyrosine ligase/Tubulin polyglutamylase [Carpediemonas membranifera]
MVTIGQTWHLLPCPALPYHPTPGSYPTRNSCSLAHHPAMASPALKELIRPLPDYRSVLRAEQTKQKERKDAVKPLSGRSGKNGALAALPQVTDAKKQQQAHQYIRFKRVLSLTRSPLGLPVVADVVRSKTYRAACPVLFYKMYKTNVTIVRATLEAAGFRETTTADWSLCWIGQHVRPSILEHMKPHQFINHWPRSYEVSRKDRLCHNISRMATVKGRHHFSFIPETYILPDEYSMLKDQLEKKLGRLEPSTVIGPHIIKPQASSRGRGIEVVDKFGQIPTTGKVVLSRYLDDPYLLNGYKFDLRIYVTVLSFDPLRIYVHEQGLVRFATEKFRSNLRGAAAKYVHLTNYSINKHNPHFEKNKDDKVEDGGSKWTLAALWSRLRALGVSVAKVQADIDDIIVKTFISVEPAIAAAANTLARPSKARCFELYGFDILLDSNLRPWLLEVNFSPSLSCDTPLDLKIKSTVISDTFTMLGVTAPQPPANPSRTMRGVSQFVSKVSPTRPHTRAFETRQPLASRPAPSETQTKRHIRQLHLESQRMAGTGWRRIFPSPDGGKYLHLFEIKRPSDEAAVAFLLEKEGGTMSRAFGGGSNVTAITGFTDTRRRPRSVPPVRRVQSGLVRRDR